MSIPHDFETPPLPPPRRRRKWLILGGLVLLLVLAVGGFYVSLRLSAERGWRAAVAEAERDDPNWRFEDLLARRAHCPDAENAALVIAATKKLVPKLWPAWDYAITQPKPLPDVPLLAFEETHAKWTEEEKKREELATSFTELQPQAQLSEHQLNVLREEMQRAEKAVAEARKLVNLPRGRFYVRYSPDWISTVLDEVQDARGVTNLLAYDALLRAQEQDLAGAMESCHAILNLCRSFDDEPMVIAMLVRVACRSVAIRRLERILAQGEPAEADLDRLQKVLEEEEAVPILLHAFRGERAGGDLLMQSMESGRIGAGAFAGGGPPVDTLQMLLPGGMRHQRTAVLTLNNRIVEIAKLPPEKQHAEAERLEGETATMPILARLLGPAQIRVARASLRGQAEARVAIAMLAAERFRQKHQRWPERLAELTPDFLTQVPSDPFDGQPLRLLRTDDGIVIYSIGPDAQDDGGKLSVREDKGTDRGIRLWDPKQRRQPAKP
jgi:hypothetical protein